jgi:hypothetical protein
MVSYLHLPIVVLCGFLLLAMWRFWTCIDRMGFTREVSKRAPSMINGDILAAGFAIVPFLIAAVDWLGVPLPRQPVPISPLLAVVLSGGCLGVCVFILWHSGERFAVTGLALGKALCVQSPPCASSMRPSWPTP